MPVEKKNGDFILKTHEMFFFNTTPGQFKNATIIGNFVSV